MTPQFPVDSLAKCMAIGCLTLFLALLVYDWYLIQTRREAKNKAAASISKAVNDFEIATIHCVRAIRSPESPASAQEAFTFLDVAAELAYLRKRAFSPSSLEAAENREVVASLGKANRFLLRHFESARTAEDRKNIQDAMASIEDARSQVMSISLTASSDFAVRWICRSLCISLALLSIGGFWLWYRSECETSKKASTGIASAEAASAG